MVSDQVHMTVLNEVRQHQQLKKRASWPYVKIALAVGLMSLVLSQVSVKSLAATWERVSLSWFLASILAFYGSIWLMARRYWILIGRRVTFPQLLNVVLLQTVAGNLVATGVGFASYIGILRRKYRVEVSYGLVSIVLARFGDLSALLIALAFASWVVWPQIVTMHVAVVLTISCMIALIVLFSLILLLRQQLVVILARIFHKLHLDRKSFVQRVLNTLTTLSDQKIEQPGVIIGAFVGYSLLILGMMLLFAYCSLQIFAVQIDIWPIIFVVSLTQVVALVPFHVFGGLGLYDVSYLYFYGLFGIDRAEFAAVIVGLRLLFYLANFLLLFVIPLRTWLRHEGDSEHA